jgi:hypothetical protein
MADVDTMEDYDYQLLSSYLLKVSGRQREWTIELAKRHIPNCSNKNVQAIMNAKCSVGIMLALWNDMPKQLNRRDIFLQEFKLKTQITINDFTSLAKVYNKMSRDILLNSVALRVIRCYVKEFKSLLHPLLWNPGFNMSDIDVECAFIAAEKHGALNHDVFKPFSFIASYIC